MLVVLMMPLLLQNTPLVGEYEMNFFQSSPRCPDSAFVRDIGDPRVFYTDLLSGETRYQIIGETTYPRTEENYMVGGFTNVDTREKYVQQRYRRDDFGNYSQLFFTMEVFLNLDHQLVANINVEDTESGGMRPHYRCVFDRIED